MIEDRTLQAKSNAALRARALAAEAKLERVRELEREFEHDENEFIRVGGFTGKHIARRLREALGDKP